ncbi:MAG: hypothetical protein HC880_22330, partial [Bacteroidia bacterium]|nr:hypothetical protein [Bacteroidia bacterium]
MITLGPVCAGALGTNFDMKPDNAYYQKIKNLYVAVNADNTQIVRIQVIYTDTRTNQDLPEKTSGDQYASTLYTVLTASGTDYQHWGYLSGLGGTWQSPLQ